MKRSAGLAAFSRTPSTRKAIRMVKTASSVGLDCFHLDCQFGLRREIILGAIVNTEVGPIEAGRRVSAAHLAFQRGVLA